MLKPFERVFSDADIVDVDFSEWDRRIVIWALADHWREWHDRKPLVRISFEQVTNFACAIPPLDEIPVESNVHAQWHVYESSLQYRGNSIQISIAGMQCSPKLTIECQQIEIDEHPMSLLDSINPKWNHPGSGLARPGIVKLNDQE